MSMNTHVAGFAHFDDKYKKMKAIFDACHDAGIDLPSEVEIYFDGTIPDERGMRISLDNHPAVTIYSSDMQDGYDIELAKLPSNVTHIRVYNSY